MAVGGFRRQAPLDTADDRACSDSVASEDLPRSRTMILRVGARCCSEVRCAWLSADGHRAATPCSPCSPLLRRIEAAQEPGRGVYQGCVGRCCVGCIVQHAVSSSWAPIGTWRDEMTGPYPISKPFCFPWTVILGIDNLWHKRR